METTAEDSKQEGAEKAQAAPENAAATSSTTTSKSKPSGSKSTPTSTQAPTPTTAPKPTSSTPTVPIPSSSSSSPASSSQATSSTHSDPPRRSKREDRNRKEDEYVKQFMKAINSAPTLEEKMQIAIQKYAHMVDDNKKMQFYIKQSEKRHTMIMKEKEQLQLEYNKTVLVKSKLENLCRELQKQNKTIKEESLLKIREEEERRKETQAKFQNTLSEITALLQQNNEKNTKLRDDNISMTEKFKNVVSQYQLREQQIEKMAKQMQLEQQLADAKFMKARLEHQAEKERLVQEMEGLKLGLHQHRARVQELQATETALRGQLAVYTDKYDEFQNALVKSNQVFGGFKEEMEKMSKKIKKLEKESLSWKKRWETSQTALLDMCGERQASEERCSAVARQLSNMQSLCRTLQSERTVLLGTLKEHNIERPPLPAPAPTPPPAPPTPASNAKVDAMAANCAQLRQSLAHLQSQLNVLTNKQQQTAEEPPNVDTKVKKSKSKKSKKQEAPKESESDSNAKESATESASEEKATTSTAKVEDKATGKVDVAENIKDKSEASVGKFEIDVNEVETDAKEVTTDDNTLESLIQAINSANINLNDNTMDMDDILHLDSTSKDDVTKSTDTASGDASEISKDSSNEASPKNEPKDIANGVKIVLVTDRLGEDAKVVEFVEEITNGPKIVEITEETANRPKIIELPDDEVLPASTNSDQKEAITNPQNA